MNLHTSVDHKDKENKSQKTNKVDKEVAGRTQEEKMNEIHNSDRIAPPGLMPAAKHKVTIIYYRNEWLKKTSKPNPVSRSS